MRFVSLTESYLQATVFRRNSILVVSHDIGFVSGCVTRVACINRTLVCGDCGEVSEMENEAILQSLQKAEWATGFKTRHTVVERLGTCAQCAEKHQSG